MMDGFVYSRFGDESFGVTIYILQGYLYILPRYTFYKDVSSQRV